MHEITRPSGMQSVQPKVRRDRRVTWDLGGRRRSSLGVQLVEARCVVETEGWGVIQQGLRRETKSVRDTLVHIKSGARRTSKTAEVSNTPTQLPPFLKPVATVFSMPSL
jgi:hypothetical protein